MTKKQVDFTVNVDDEWDGNLLGLEDRIIARVMTHVTVMGWDASKVSWLNMTLDVDYYGYDGGKVLKVKTSRLETDDEYATRIDFERKRKVATQAKKKTQKEKDLAELERLAKKHGKKLI